MKTAENAQIESKPTAAPDVERMNLAEIDAIALPELEPSEDTLDAGEVWKRDLADVRSCVAAIVRLEAEAEAAQAELGKLKAGSVPFADAAEFTAKATALEARYALARRGLEVERARLPGLVKSAKAAGSSLLEEERRDAADYVEQLEPTRTALAAERSRLEERIKRVTEACKRLTWTIPLERRDTLGNVVRISEGEARRMSGSFGSKVTFSQFRATTEGSRAAELDRVLKQVAPKGERS